MQASNVLCFFRKLGFGTRIKLFKAFCSSMYGCELWSLNDSRPINEFCVAWRKALRRVINVPYNCHSCFLPLLSDTLPIFDELCKRSFRFILSCVFRGSPLVRAVAHHALKIARYSSVIGSNALFCCKGTAGRQLIFWRVKLMFAIHIFKKYVIIHLVDRISVLLGLYLKFCVFGKGSFIFQIDFFSYLRLMK